MPSPQETDALADIVAGPDAYRDLPRLIGLVRGGGSSGAMNVQLSADETYADIRPVRPDGAVSAFLSVMRGCNNMCAFCIVPFTRGRERSRPTASVLDEVRALADQGVREVTLLGQNVNSFADFSERAEGSAAAASASASAAAAPFGVYAPGFRSVYVPQRGGALRFAELLARVAAIEPEMRVRFTSPHPKDFPAEVLSAVAAHANICKQLHLPAQSGSTAVLARMRRGYDREAYLALAAHVREALPGVALSSDFISGFCGETDAEHADTISLLRTVRYETAFMFAYSRREKTAAARHLADDVPADVKQRRLAEVIATFREGATARAAAETGALHCVLVEGPSRRSADALTGRTDTNKRVVFDDVAVPLSFGTQHGPTVRLKPGDYVAVRFVVSHARCAFLVTAASLTRRDASGARHGRHHGEPARCAACAHHAARVLWQRRSCGERGRGGKSERCGAVSRKSGLVFAQLRTAAPPSARHRPRVSHSTQPIAAATRGGVGAHANARARTAAALRAAPAASARRKALGAMPCAYRGAPRHRAARFGPTAA